MMTPISAAQAISPAFENTKLFLFKPFRWTTFLKLTLVATLTEGGVSSCNLNSGFPGGKSSGNDVPFHMPNFPAIHPHFPAMPIVIGVLVVFLLFVVPIGIFFGYLLIRLRFSFFDCVLYRRHQIAPAWAKYHREAMRFLGLSLCLTAAAWIVLAATGFALYNKFKPLIESIMHGGHPTFSDFLPVIALAGPLFLLLALVGGLLNVLLGDFVLPRIALEDASIEDSLTDVWVDIKAEPGQFILFILLRYVLCLVGSIAGLIGLFIPFVFVAGILAVIVLLVKAASVALAFVIGIPAAILLLALLIVAGIGLSGAIGTLRRQYSLVFYSGRYQALADILQPQAPPQWRPAFYPPTSPGGSPSTPPSKPGAF